MLDTVPCTGLDYSVTGLSSCGVHQLEFVKAVRVSDTSTVDTSSMSLPATTCWRCHLGRVDVQFDCEGLILELILRPV